VILPFYYFNATPKIKNCKQAAHFAKRNTKFGGGGKARALAIFFNVSTVGLGLSPVSILTTVFNAKSASFEGRSLDKIKSSAPTPGFEPGTHSLRLFHCFQWR